MPPEQKAFPDNLWPGVPLTAAYSRWSPHRPLHLPHGDKGAEAPREGAK